MHFEFVLFVNYFLIISATLFPIRIDFSDSSVDYTPPESEITFHLYHSGDLSEDDRLSIDNIASIHMSRFDPDLPTKLIIHGWTHGKDVPWVIELRELMARKNLWNIVVVDWSKLSHAAYAEARIHTNIVAKQLAKFCLTLIESTNIPMMSVHMIGHSMGAQIAAMAGHQIRSSTGQTIGRISGLDPAGPLYEWPHIETLDDILDPSDADFVDVIHTNCKRFGIVFPAGHVDFYPNGGQHQPGCRLWSCSHLKSVEFWIASVRNPQLFQAVPVRMWRDYLEGNLNNSVVVPMGIATSAAVPIGSYFLTIHNDLQNRKATTAILENYLFL